MSGSKKTYHHLIDRYELSPHCHDRLLPIDLIVLHKIALPLHDPSLDFVCQFFQGTASYSQCSFLATQPKIFVSSHFVVGKKGTIVQCVDPEKSVAWHCGHSLFQGRTACNEFSIGIEFVGFETEDLTVQQYHAGQALLLSLREQFTIPKSHVVGHREVSLGRKTDPGSYNKEQLLDS